MSSLGQQWLRYGRKQTKPKVLHQVQAGLKRPLKDAAVINASRWALFERLQSTGLPVETGSGGLTKYNRTRQHLPKTH